MATTTKPAAPTVVPQEPLVMGQSQDVRQVLAAINKVMQEVGYVKKTTTQNLPYSFASEAMLIQALRPAMVEAGLVLWVSHVETSADEQFTNKKGTIMTRVKTTAKLRIGHAKSGQWIEVASQGEGIDSGDKATPKALTGFYKYALRETFLIETGDDPDFSPSLEQERGDTKANGRPVEFAGNEAIGSYAELLKKAKDAGITLPKDLVIDFSSPVPLDKLRDHYRKIATLVEEAQPA